MTVHHPHRRDYRPHRAPQPGGRRRYLDRIDAAAETAKLPRKRLGCANQAHSFAGCGAADKAVLRSGQGPNLAIVTSYNDMLSAHQPFEHFPELIRGPPGRWGNSPGRRRRSGHVRRRHPGRGGYGAFAVLARCHRAFNGGRAVASDLRRRGLSRRLRQDRARARDRRARPSATCRRVFIPAGPMTSGLPNEQKGQGPPAPRRRKSGPRRACWRPKSRSYHSPGTCTFYGTANTNQVLMEIMGLHVPGSAFINPNTPLRDAITREAAKRALAITVAGQRVHPDRPRAGRARVRQQRRRPARDRRLH